jgi:uncharacterized protein (TIGR00299 family) protein
MFLGALADIGVPVGLLQQAVDALRIGRIELRAEPAVRHGIGGTRIRVLAAADRRPRSWADIRTLVTAAELTEPVRRTALDVFRRLAEAESAVHRVPADEVHFHEVGGLDAVADVVGTCAGLAHLELAELVAGPVTLGSQPVTEPVHGLHGVVPIPGPAVLALLAAADAPVQAGPARYEMCTPTGAALLASHVTGWGPLPLMRIQRTGCGVGDREVAELPNLLRLVIGEPVQAPAVRPVAAWMLEANVDDLDPRLWPTVLARLLSVGASDVWLTPILMKKGRPAQTLHILCRPEVLAAVRHAVFTETSTIGLREHAVGKNALERRSGTVQVDGVPVRVKVAVAGGAAVNVSVEYDDVVAAAATLGRPAKEILARATGLAERFRADPPAHQG